MPVFLLNEELFFPDPALANEDGLLAIGGELDPARLLLAYESGIFPWYSPPDPALWWSPDPRCVVYTDRVKVSKSMRNVLNRKPFEITFDQAFLRVIDACSKVDRKNQNGTWITNEVKTSYHALHELGIAHSVEAWNDGELVGGLYGVSLGTMFFGESMFATVSNASKVAFISLCRVLHDLGFELIDCQIYNDHLGSLGAELINRTLFLDKLHAALENPTRKGSWAFMAHHLK